MNLFKCRICGDETTDGINILGIHICKKCEKDMIESRMESIKYEYYKSVIRKSWIDYIFQSS